MRKMHKWGGKTSWCSYLDFSEFFVHRRWTTKKISEVTIHEYVHLLNNLIKMYEK